MLDPKQESIGGSMLAYHNDPLIKSSILSQLRKHRTQDQIVKGRYWEDGKGCAVGCTIHSSNHILYQKKFGIPESSPVEVSSLALDRRNR
jgi:hypothetical protein